MFNVGHADLMGWG